MKSYLMKHSILAVALLLAALAIVLFLTTGNPVALMLPAAAPTVEDLATAVNDGLKSMRDDLGLAKKELEAKTAAGEKGLTTLKEQIDKMLTDFNGLKGSFTELEQKANQRPQEPEGEKSWGEQFVTGAQYKAAEDRANRRGTIVQEIKTVTSTNAGGLIRSARETEITTLLRERRVMRDLLRTVPITTSSVDYAVQTTRTNAAAPVAEAAAKPYSDYVWSSATVVVRTLAHLAKITRQAMDDAPRLIGEIDSEMRYGLGYVEERQFLYGSGVGQNLLGIVPQATAFASPGGATIENATMIDVLRLAMLQGAVALLPPDGIVLNDIEWALIELTKTTEGAYLFSNPQGNVSPRMWGLPVVATPAMVAGDYLVGNFRQGATVYDRMGVEVLISTENDFEKNLATMRAEERVAIAVKRPGAFITGTFADDITAITPAP
jgi:HK97 family phage major capsid protein